MAGLGYDKCCVMDVDGMAVGSNKLITLVGCGITGSWVSQSSGGTFLVPPWLCIEHTAWMVSVPLSDCITTQRGIKF